MERKTFLATVTATLLATGGAIATPFLYRDIKDGGLFGNRTDLDGLLRKIFQHDIVHFGESDVLNPGQETTILEDAASFIFPKLRDPSFGNPYDEIRFEPLPYEFNRFRERIIPEAELEHVNRTGEFAMVGSPVMQTEVSMREATSTIPRGLRGIVRHSVTELGFEVGGLSPTIYESSQVGKVVNSESRDYVEMQRMLAPDANNVHVPNILAIHLLRNAGLFRSYYFETVADAVADGKRLVLYGDLERNDDESSVRSIGDEMKLRYGDKVVCVDLVKPVLERMVADANGTEMVNQERLQMYQEATGINPFTIKEIHCYSTSDSEKADYVILLPSTNNGNISGASRFS